MARTFEQLREFIFTLDIIDTHEHLPGFERDRSLQYDVLGEYLIHYMPCDLMSAGMARRQFEQAIDASVPISKRWKIVESFWQASRNTAYARSLDLSVKGVYGLDKIDAATIEPLNEAFLAARAKGGTYQRVLKELSKIRLSIADTSAEVDPKFFAGTMRLDNFVRVANRRQLDALAQQAGASAIHTLEDLEQACEAFLDAWLAKGIVAIKCGLAYNRSLRFNKVAPATAAADFNQIYDDHYVAPGWEPANGPVFPNLQDHMMHHICRLADRRSLVMQIHTGLQEGNGNIIYHSDPALLSNLFMEYRNVRFDVFHIGLPYQQVVSVLAKNFPNVFVDFAWVHIAAPAAAVAAMVDMLDMVPANKIMGFGGDYCFVDGVYGHQHIARTNVARALAAKVDAGDFDLEQAQRIATMMLHDNAIALFGLKKHLRPASTRKLSRTEKQR